jgi:uncharacterized protein YcsI (UPF0317 family)
LARHSRICFFKRIPNYYHHHPHNQPMECEYIPQESMDSRYSYPCSSLIKVSERAKNGQRMQWLRMIPSEDARKTHRGIRRYFQLQGEPIDISQSSENEDIGIEDPEDEDEEEEAGHGYGEAELDIFEGGVYGNHD